VRDHTHRANAAAPGEGDISVAAGNLKALPPPIPANAPPAAANPKPESATYADGRLGGDGKTVTPDPNEPIRTNSKPVAGFSPNTPTANSGDPKQGFDIQLVRDQRAGHQPQECGAQPGCDISASVRSVGSVAVTEIFSTSRAIKGLAEGAYATVRDWF
jgi:hypothetical protein